jgi:cytochrome c553
VSLLQAGRWALGLTALFISTGLAQERVQLCAACHGADGNSTTVGVPSIAGQPKLFIENQLVLFREGMRESDQMFAAMKGLKDPEIIKLAEHFSKLPAKAPPGIYRKDLFLMGQQLAMRNRCGICHLADFSGQQQVPRLAGQREEYLLAEMKAYRDNKRRGGDTIMAASLYGITDDEIAALAHFLSRRVRKPVAR